MVIYTFEDDIKRDISEKDEDFSLQLSYDERWKLNKKFEQHIKLWYISLTNRQSKSHKLLRDDRIFLPIFLHHSVLTISYKKKILLIKIIITKYITQSINIRILYV